MMLRPINIYNWGFITGLGTGMSFALLANNPGYALLCALATLLNICRDLDNKVMNLRGRYFDQK